MSDELITNEKLLERVRRAEEMAQEVIIVAAVYREQIKRAAELAERAVRENHPDFLHGALSLVELALDEKNVKDWAKSWREAWTGDINWLEKAIFQMKKVKDAANRLDTETSPTNAEIQRIILDAARAVLIQRIPSSVNLDARIDDEQHD